MKMKVKSFKIDEKTQIHLKELKEITNKSEGEIIREAIKKYFTILPTIKINELLDNDREIINLLETIHEITKENYKDIMKNALSDYLSKKAPNKTILIVSGDMKWFVQS